jgi:hypothetical protein
MYVLERGPGGICDPLRREEYYAERLPADLRLRFLFLLKEDIIREEIRKVIRERMRKPKYPTLLPYRLTYTSLSL